MEVVEVLPWLPATAMPYFLSRISSASISARWMTGMCCSRAATTSGLSTAMAVEVTTTSAPSTQGASWPSWITPPIPAKRRVMSVVRRSEPLTR